jgi:hypothetical protein
LVPEVGVEPTLGLSRTGLETIEHSIRPAEKRLSYAMLA